MCGIVGYIGSRTAAPILLEALKRLEYRGYDSAGIATLSRKIHVKKDRGRVADIDRALHLDDMPGNVGIAHCLHPKTSVQLADGRIVNISEIGEESQVIAYDFKGKKFKRAKALCFKHLSPPYLHKIRTPSAEIVCTENHRLFVTDSNGWIIEKKAGNIKKNDLLLCVEKVSIEGKSKDLKCIRAKKYLTPTKEAAEVLKKDIISVGLSNVAKRCGISKAVIAHIMRNDRKIREDWLNSLIRGLNLKLRLDSFTPSDTTHGKWIVFPQQTNEKLMQVVGYIFGDGYVGKRTIRMKDMDKFLLTKYNKLFEELFGVSGRIARMNQTKAYLLEINSKYLCEWIRENFPELLDGGCPTWLGELPDSQVFAFIGGFFDAEGVVGLRSRQLAVRTTNEKMMKTIQTLLLRAGILASYAEQKRHQDSNWNHVYSLTISNKDDVESFIGKIPILSDAKREKTMTILCELRKGRSYTHLKVPILKEKIRESIKDPCLKGTGYATTYSVKKILQNGGPKWMSEFLDAPTVFQKVISNEKVPSDTKYVYDLEVPGFENFVANCTISHNSRWATHGAPSRLNAHPHTDSSGRVAVVHNGIIENYVKLRRFLKKHGHRFVSETDTEVIPNLIAHFMKQGKNFEASIREATKRLKGSFALAILSVDEPNKLVAVRKESPLILGLGGKEMFLASDIPAMLHHTKKFVVLENDEMAVLTPEKAVIKNVSSGKAIKKRPVEVRWTAEMAEKMGYPHFTLKEICQQPDAIRDTLRTPPAELERLAKLLLGARRIYLVACGTSYHAALVGKYALAKLADISVEVVISSEFQESCRVDGKTAILAITQSGETADTMKAVRVAKAGGAKVACLTNVVGSSITRESDLVCHTHAGPEVSVVATKTFAAQVAYLLLLAIHLAEKKGLSKSKADKLVTKLHETPDTVRAVIAGLEPQIKKLAKRYRDAQHIYLIGRGTGYPIVLEGALKLKEITYIHSEAMPAGELKHGTLALIDNGTPVIAVVPPGESRARMLSNIEEVKARGAIVIAVADESDDVRGHVDEFIPIPHTEELFSPLVYIIPLQLLAYHMTVMRGQNPDRPRSLAKSVTVE